MKREKKLSLAVISSFAALASMLIYTGVVFANPPKTTANNQPNSEASQADPNSGNSENNNSNSGNSGAKNKYVIKDFETGETLKLDQQGFDEYMKKWTDKGFISVEVDPSVQESMEKTWLEDASSKPKTGCYAKEAK